MAGYSLIASESTSQVVSPTLVIPVEYCTIRTDPSGAIVSAPVSRDVFDAGASGTLLSSYAANVEYLLGHDHVVGATGSQTLDNSGLLQDNVVFTVQYMPAGATATAVTADAIVPSNLLLEGGDPSIEGTLLASAAQIIDNTYNNLAAAAGG